MKNSRFPALIFSSALFIGIGWTLVVIGILLVAFYAISLFISSAATGFGADLTGAIASGLGSLALVLTGLFTVTGGESIRVLLAIEENTRAWTTVVARTE